MTESADGTVELCARICELLAKQEAQIANDNRKNRKGFKRPIYRRQAFKEAAAAIRSLKWHTESAAASPTADEPIATMKDSASGSADTTGGSYRTPFEGFTSASID